MSTDPPHIRPIAPDPFERTVKTLAELWSEVLQLKRPPEPADDFFALGGNSMAMVTLEFRIQEELPVQLSPGTVLRAPTLGELSRWVHALMEGKDPLKPL